jgi:flagellar biogenesis protein FliO
MSDQLNSNSVASSGLGTTDVKIPLIFNVIEFLLLACCVGAIAVAVLFQAHLKIVIYTIAALTILVFLILLNRRFQETYKRAAKQLDNQRKAELYNCMFGKAIGVEDDPINLIRGRAIEYSQELIDDYKVTRRNARNIYYVFQLSTVVLSGVTPILVLLDKLDTGSSLTRWLPVIFPAIAAIVTSISTSFPFQKTWLAANTTFELLEAEQEKFILGVSPYRFYDLPDEAQRQQKVQESVETFINQVNTIHLNQIQSPQPEAKPTSESRETAKAGA